MCLFAELMFVICWLLHPDPRWRATIKDLEDNEWVNRPVDIARYSFDAVLCELTLKSHCRSPILLRVVQNS